MSIPNIITAFRIVLVPVFIVLILYYRGGGSEIFRWSALGVFVVAISSDAVDGLVARLKNQRTVIGSFLDPLADKILLVSAVVLLSLGARPLARLPLWFPVLVVSRDIMIVCGALLIHMLAGKVTPTPSVAGKCTTFLQTLTVIWVLVGVPAYQIPLGVAAVFTASSGIEYIYLGMKQLQGVRPR